MTKTTYLIIQLRRAFKNEIKKTLARRDAGYISSLDSDSDWLLSTTEHGDLDDVKVNYHANSKQSKHKISDLFTSYTKKHFKTNLYISGITIVVAKHLNSALNKQISQKPLHVLFDSGSEGSVINHKYTTFGKYTKIVSPTS